MTVTPAIRLLVVTDDSLFGDYTAAAVDRYPDMSVVCVSTLSAARARIANQAVDCVVLDTDLSHHGIRQLHRLLGSERPQLPVVLASSRPRTELYEGIAYHAFVQKHGPTMGTSLADAVRVLATANPIGDHDTTPATADYYGTVLSSDCLVERLPCLSTLLSTGALRTVSTTVD